MLPWDVEDRLLPLNGVVAAGAFGDANTGSARIRTNAINDPTDRAQLKLRVVGASAGLFAAIKTQPVAGRFFDGGHDARADRVAVIGTGIAEQLGIRDLSRRPVIFIGDEAFSVIGIMDAPKRESALANAIINPGGTAAARFGLGGPHPRW